MLKYIPSYSLAKNIVSKIRNQPVMSVVNGTIGTFSNGREQGLYITVYPDNKFSASFARCYAIAENRNSDGIVVYTGENHSLQTGQDITEKVYKERMLFNGDDTNGCIEYIISDIKFYFL